METLTLKEFLETVKNSLRDTFPLQYWITAEIASFRVNPTSRHCYIDLVEKTGQAVTAKTGGVIWRGRFDYVSKKFAEAAGQEFKEGLKVMLLVDILFHEVYGFKLNITDIDPSYTIGEFALHRKKVIEKLEKEGLLNKNKEIPFPLVPQKIAVISSPSAAGYEDFINTLNHNPYGYVFRTKLFPAYMQGEQAEKSIIGAMEACLAAEDGYDVAIVIRGGGDQVDLHSFDSYDLGKTITGFPIPVITGIGHKRDESVADLAAHTKLISPTAVAEFIIARTKGFEEKLDRVSQRFVTRVNNALSQKLNVLESTEKHLNIFTHYFFERQQQDFKNISSDFRTGVAKRVASNEFVLKQIPANISRAVHLYIKAHLNNLERKKDKIDFMHPDRVLKRGYTLTFRNGSLVKDAGELKSGDILETKFHKGTSESIVRESKKPES